MRRLLAATLTAAAFLVGATSASGGHALELLDHPAPSFAPTLPPEATANQSPLLAWQFVATIPTGNPHTDLDYFTQKGETFASVGTLAFGPNGGGQTIIQLTEDGEIGPLTPKFVSSHGSAFCPSDPVQSLGLQHDVEATPKGDALLNTAWPFSVRTDTQLLVDATDNPGRCHDNGAAFGFVQTPPGGLELIDVTNVQLPKEIHLTSHIGEAHTVNIDPKRPHIAYAVTSDAIGVNPDGSRQNENPGDSDRFDLDGFEVVDMSSCMNFELGTTLEQKRGGCRPQVYRYRYPSAAMSIGHTLKSGNDSIIHGCHELEVYPNDRLTCGSGQAAMVFDMSGAFDRNGKPRGTPLPCRVRPSTSTFSTTGALVTDCVIGKDGQDLSIPGWKAIGSPSLEGVRFLGSAFHQGRGGPYDSTEDNDFDHELELSGSGRLILATDERGGGVSPPGASCAAGSNETLRQGNGGVHAYRVDRLLMSSPTGPNAAETAWQSYARTPDGDKAIYRAEVFTPIEPTICTAHVFHQIPGQNRIFMAWYSQGTQVVDFIEHPDGTVTFEKAGHFIPTGANEWVSAIFKVRENADGTYTYWGATGDFTITHGRNAIDVYKVTLPAPPKPLVHNGGGAQANRTTGGGWLLDNGGKKINFGFSVRETASSFEGNLQLNDKGAAAKIHMTEVTSLGAVEEPCGSVPEGPSSLQFRGTGTFNGASASFRVCVQDNGEGSNDSADLFYLECSCGYNTDARTPDDAIDGGNIQVRRSTTVASGEPRATTLILDPVLLSNGVAGQTQLLTVRAYDQYQEPLAGASVTVTKTTSDGGVERLAALTGAAGTATTVITNVLGAAEYTASVGGVQSNAIEIVSLVG